MHDAATRLRRHVIDGAVRGPGKAGGPARLAAFENRDVDPRARALIDKVTRHAWKVTDEDVAAVKAAGLSEDEIYELVVCAALGQSSRQLDAALAALDQATPAGGAPSGTTSIDTEADA
jgi:hypothetical protein